MNRGIHDNTDLINEFDFRVFRVFKFLRIVISLKRTTRGFFALFVFPLVVLFRLLARYTRDTRRGRVAVYCDHGRNKLRPSRASQVK